MLAEQSPPIQNDNVGIAVLKSLAHLLAVTMTLIIIATALPAYTDVLVTKDGEIIYGEIIIRTEDTVIMRTDQGRKTLKLDDIKDVPENELLLLGRLIGARKLINTGETFVQLERLPDADKAFRDALEALAEITDEQAGDKITERDSTIARAKDRLTELNNLLESRGLALHQGFLLNAADLKKHLQHGHAIFAGKLWIHPSQICPECSGTGVSTCSYCKGPGSIPVVCRNCINGKLTCKNCSATGIITCPHCGGKGQFIRTCTNCGGDGTIRCRRCHGDGDVERTCPRCHGIGRRRITIKKTDENGNEIVTTRWSFCYHCWGVGSIERRCSECDGDGFLTCRTCNGRGKITTLCSSWKPALPGIPPCNGTGNIQCPVCNGRGFAICPVCNGTSVVQSVCTSCGGAGATSCRTCGGRGFTGDPKGFVGGPPLPADRESPKRDLTEQTPPKKGAETNDKSGNAETDEDR